MDELKPCPFCGEASAIVVPTQLIKSGNEYAQGDHYIHCECCGTDGPPEPSEEEAIEAWNRRAEQVPEGWIRAADEELVSAHLNVANQSDTYEDAKKKLSRLIDWHVSVAADPKVNGGYKLVPVEPTVEMLNAMRDQNESGSMDNLNAYKAMLAAAP